MSTPTARPTRSDRASGKLGAVHNVWFVIWPIQFQVGIQFFPKKSAQAMSDALTRDEGKTSDDIEDLIAEYQIARGPQPNISYFAFTATPRNVTLERYSRLILQLLEYAAVRSRTHEPSRPQAQ